jgi:phosphoglycolate phosphatase-like HAD superfamily hydrolase
MTERFKGVQAVIFDLDGTLVSVEERFYRVFLDTLKAHHLPPMEKDLFMKKFSVSQLDDFLSIGDKHTFWVTFLEAYNGSHKECSKVLPGVREVLERLRKKGIKIGVITGRLCEPDDALAELHRLNLGDLVDVVVTKKLVLTQLKPEELFSRPLEIIQALERLGADLNKAVLVADYVTDIESAKSLGMKVVAVLSGSSNYESLKEMAPDAIIKSMSELPPLLGL